MLPRKPQRHQRGDRASTAPICGLAWDGDFDRCFFFDEHGEFIEGYYIVGLLAAVFLTREPGARIVHDPRLTWNTHRHRAVARAACRCMCKSGHAFIKERDARSRCASTAAR